MPASRCRPFTVLDAMILVAATAVGFWLAARSRPRQLGDLAGSGPRMSTSGEGLRDCVHAVLTVVVSQPRSVDVP